MIQYDASQRTITLSTRSTSYQMKLHPTGVLLHTYYGPRLRGGDLSRLICPEDRGFSPNPDEVGRDRTWSLDTQPQEYSSSGVGDFRLPSLEAELGEFMAKLYKRYVPSQTREYIESMDDPEDRSRPRPNRITKPAGPDAGKEGE